MQNHIEYIYYVENPTLFLMNNNVFSPITGLLYAEAFCCHIPQPLQNFGKSPIAFFVLNCWYMFELKINPEAFFFFFFKSNCDTNQTLTSKPRYKQCKWWTIASLKAAQPNIPNVSEMKASVLGVWPESLHTTDTTEVSAGLYFLHKQVLLFTHSSQM